METSLESLGYQQELKRVLKLKDAILYGLAMITPTAPFPMLGIIAFTTAGHMPAAYLIALVGMSLTALSYGKMSAAYPVAGSAYSYTQRTISSEIGFLAGWAMILDYVLMPLLSVIFISVACAEKFPQVPYFVWVALITIALTVINLFGISVTSKANTVFNALMVVIVIFFVGLACRFLLAGHGAATLVSTLPLYNPQTFQFSAVMAGASIAVFSYLGFDGVSTIAEEVENPSKNIGRAIFLTCILSGIIFLVVTYLAQLVWPDFASFPEKREVVVFRMAEMIGGKIFEGFIFFIIIVAGVSCALVGQASASRLLYSMGRDAVLPKGFFGYVSPKYQTPVYNILLMGVVSLIGGLASSFQQVAEVVNFGAFLGFICVSLSVIFYYFKKRKNSPEKLGWGGYVVLPVLAIVVCAAIFINLSPTAKVLGAIWTGCGFIYLLIVSRGFKRKFVLKNL
jgi:amino acid transporter